jgi:hypothetical protein
MGDTPACGFGERPTTAHRKKTVCYDMQNKGSYLDEFFDEAAENSTVTSFVTVLRAKTY